jgi:long-chain acyl-CoA synthetase
VQQLIAAGVTLLQRSAPLVRALSGRRSAILLPTSPSFLVALAASEGRGAVLVNPLASAREIAHQLSDANVGAVFTNAELAERVAANIVRVLLDDAPRTASVLAQGGSRDVDLGSHLGLSLEGDTTAPGRDEEAAIIYTSAMAGQPLGAVLTHHNLIVNARSTIAAAAITSDERALALLPLSHLFGLTVTGSTPLLAGGRVFTMARFNPARAIDRIVDDRITLLVGVPAVFQALLAAIERRARQRDGLESLRVCMCGGAALPTELQDRWFDTTGVELRQGYGLTEAGPVCLYNNATSANVRGTLGVPLPGVEVSIRAPVTWSHDGMPQSGGETSVPDGSAGEICIRGENVFAGYVSGRERGLVKSDGWLHTGDLGNRNPDGTFTFLDVIKPMFTRSGFNIYPREIEAAVRELRGVREAAVRAIPTPARENDIGLTVRGEVAKDDVARWCEERLASYKQPSEIDIEQ